MRCNRHRKWKPQDIQGESPLSWCKKCGAELYRGMRQDSLCPQCRLEEEKRVRKP